MIKAGIGLMEELKAYSSPKSKITRLIRSGELIQLRRGLFFDTTESEYSTKVISGLLYGPSYVSFETALAYYSLIPEMVTIITCAAYNKNKNKVYNTELGSFHYYHIPNAVYPLGLNQRQESGYNFLIATPEKAILDMLYRQANKETDIYSYLIESMRMNFEDLSKLDSKVVSVLAPLYKRNLCLQFSQFLQKEVKNA